MKRYEINLNKRDGIPTRIRATEVDCPEELGLTLLRHRPLNTNNEPTDNGWQVTELISGAGFCSADRIRDIPNVIQHRIETLGVKHIKAVIVDFIKEHGACNQEAQNAES